MKNWLMAIAGGAIMAAAVWLIIIFAPQVLLLLEGIVGILVGIAGGVILAIGAGGIKSALEETRAKRWRLQKQAFQGKAKKE